MPGNTISESTMRNHLLLDTGLSPTHLLVESNSLLNKNAIVATNAVDNNAPVAFQQFDIDSASQMLAHKYPTEYVAENYQKALQELYYVLLGVGAFLFLVYLGWAMVQKVNYLAGGKFVYNAGLIGGILMLVALLYSVLKRVRFFRRYTTSDTWYYLHIASGSLGGFLVILHSSFDLASINSSVAFISMLLVIISGALGRYLLTLINIVQHKQYAEIRGLEPELFSHLSLATDSNRIELISDHLPRFVIRCLRQPVGTRKFLARIVLLPWHGIRFYLMSAWQLRAAIKNFAKSAGLSMFEIRAVKKIKQHQLRQYVFYIVKMGYMSLLEQIFRRWRILHVPLLYILAITSIIHVVVIHMY